MITPVFTDIMALFCICMCVHVLYSQWCQGGREVSYISAAVSEAVSPLPID